MPSGAHAHNSCFIIAIRHFVIAISYQHDMLHASCRMPSFLFNDQLALPNFVTVDNQYNDLPTFLNVFM